jgi:hypothetical protein
MCFVWISEQRAIISLCSINYFFNKGGVYLLRGTGWIFMYDRLCLSLKDRATALDVCRWPFTVKNRVWFLVGPCEICGGQWHWNSLCPSNSLLPCQLVPICHQCSILSSFTCCSYQEAKRTTSANLSKCIFNVFFFKMLTKICQPGYISGV